MGARFLLPARWAKLKSRGGRASRCQSKPFRSNSPFCSGIYGASSAGAEAMALSEHNQMTERQLVIELLAIKLYEMECTIQKVRAPWEKISEADRQVYRDLVINARNPKDLYED
jgi:hypothetical protein